MLEFKATNMFSVVMHIVFMPDFVLEYVYVYLIIEKLWMYLTT